MGSGTVVVVTKEYQFRAGLAGACRKVRLGTPLERIPSEDLEWASSHVLSIGERIEIAKKVPLALFGSPGSGYGSGYGYGYGYGDGSGYGYGYGGTELAMNARRANEGS